MGRLLEHLNEMKGKKKLPAHLKKILKTVKEREDELAKFGFKVTDKTPKGYGPNESKLKNKEIYEAGKVKRNKIGSLIHTAKGYLDEVEEAADVENYKLAKDILKNVGKILQDIKVGLK